MNKNEEIKRNYITLYHATLVFSHAFCCANNTFLVLYNMSTNKLPPYTIMRCYRNISLTLKNVLTNFEWTIFKFDIITFAFSYFPSSIRNA